MDFIEQVLRELSNDASDAQIQETALQLERMTFEPMLLIPTPGFLRMNKADIGRELERVFTFQSLEISDGMKSKHIELLLYYYDLLCRLRRDEPEAWDTVNELYEDD